jgi:hypothetical protein
VKNPQLVHVHQKFDDTAIHDVEDQVINELKKLQLKFTKGSRIAITAGSRGIDNIAVVLRTVGNFVRNAGAIPFFIPAMGSHGGATAEGQLMVLRELGIVPEFIGAPILSSMETVVIGHLRNFALPSCHKLRDIEINIDKNAFESDGIIVVNRIKPHTSFHADFESGMLKMMAIGMGKRIQAEIIHSFGTNGLRTLIQPVAQKILDTGKIIAGIGLVENAYDKLKIIQSFRPEDILPGEKMLIAEARKNMPSLPVDVLDVLIVEEIGKNYSGTGMDTNIIGRIKIDNETEPEKPSIKKIVALDLSTATNGNAYGIGLADFITQKLFDKIDLNSTYANVIATNFFERVKIPFIAKNESEAIKMAINSCSQNENYTPRIIRIKNTLNLEDIWVSENLLNEIVPDIIN